MEEIHLSTIQIGRLQLFNEKETIHPTISTVETKETKFIRWLKPKRPRNVWKRFTCQQCRLVDFNCWMRKKPSIQPFQQLKPKRPNLFVGWNQRDQGMFGRDLPVNNANWSTSIVQWERNHPSNHFNSWNQRDQIYSLPSKENKERKETKVNWGRNLQNSFKPTNQHSIFWRNHQRDLQALHFYEFLTKLKFITFTKPFYIVTRNHLFCCTAGGGTLPTNKAKVPPPLLETPPLPNMTVLHSVVTE